MLSHSFNKFQHVSGESVVHSDVCVLFIQAFIIVITLCVSVGLGSGQDGWGEGRKGGDEGRGGMDGAMRRGLAGIVCVIF